jgi:hypothetical protein
MHQLREQLRATRPKKSSASDHLTMKFIKQNQEILEPLLLVIINNTINSSIFPEGLKTSRILPLLKKGKVKTNPQSYRPINILPSVSRLIEKLIAVSLNDHLELNDLIPGQHHGGRNNHSTTTAITTIVDNWANQLQENNTNAVVIIDQSAAYDLINHRILMRKLEVLGITTKALALISSFLDGRQQQVTVDGQTSGSLHIGPVSVVQGSVLSCILFLIYTLDMPLIHHDVQHDAVGEARCSMPSSSSFVDDWVITIRETKDRPLQQGINETMIRIENYMKANQLALNTDKTQLMIITRQKQNQSNLIIENANPELIVKPVQSIKLLGITISADLLWTKYLLTGKDSLLTQLRTRITMLSKVCKYASKANRIKLANGIFASKLSYCMEAWGTAPKYILKKLQAQQTSALHLIHGTQSLRWNRTRLLKESKWLGLDLQVRFTSAKYTHKILNGKGPQQLTQLMVPRSTNQSRLTRSTVPGRLGVKPGSLGRTMYTKYTYRNQAYDHFASIPSELSSIIKVVNFRNRTKRYLINNDDLAVHRCNHGNCRESRMCGVSNLSGTIPVTVSTLTTNNPVNTTWTHQSPDQVTLFSEATLGSSDSIVPSPRTVDQHHRPPDTGLCPGPSPRPRAQDSVSSGVRLRTHPGFFDI